MVMSVLEVGQRAIGTIGLDLPTGLVSATDTLGIQLRGLMNDTAADIMDRYDWQQLLVETSFTTVSGDEQIADMYSTYSDFLRWQDNTEFNRSQDRPLHGSVSPQGWQSAKSKLTVTPEYHFRIRGNSLLLFGNTSTTDEIYFEYVSNKWLINAARDTKYSTMQDDTDLPLLDDQLLMLGTRWRFKRENGLEYGEDYRAYERRMKNLIGRNVSREPLSLVPGNTIDLGNGTVPDGQFGS